MLLNCVVILAIYVTFVLLTGVMCYVVLHLKLHESHAYTAQIGRKTPTKSSCPSVRVVIPKQQYFPGHQGCYLSGQNIYLILGSFW